MPATPTQTLINYATCYICLPSVSQGEAVQLALWDMIAQTISPSPPTDNTLTLTPAVGSPTIVSNPTGNLNFDGDSWVSAVAFNCPNLTGLSFANNPDLATLTLTGCPALSSVSIVNASITTLDFAECSTAFTVLLVSGCGSLTSLFASTILTVGGDLIIIDNASLISADFSSLTSISSQLLVTGCATLSSLALGALTFCGSISVQALPSLAVLSLPSLENVTGVVDIEGMLIMATIDLSSLTKVVSPFVINGCTNLTNINISSVIVIQADFSITFCVSLVTISIPSLSSVIDGNITITDNDALTSYSMNGQPWENNGENIFFSNNALNEATVDLILQSGVDGSMTFGTIDTSGGTASAPSVAGDANKAALILAGVAVTTN